MDLRTVWVEREENPVKSLAKVVKVASINP
jgi:hypothetical protein